MSGCSQLSFDSHTTLSSTSHNLTHTAFTLDIIKISTYKKPSIAFPFFENKKIASKKAFSVSQNKSRLMRLMPALQTVKELKVRALIFG